MKSLVALIALVSMFAVSAPRASAADERLEVVATAAPLFDVAGSVGGSHGHTTNIVALNPFGPIDEARKQELRNASLAIILGKGTQPEIEEVAAQRTKPTIRVLDLLEGADKDDPYAWLDPNNMMVIAGEIQAQMSALDPAHSEDFAKSRAGFHRMLADIDRIHERTLATCARRELLTAQPHFGYLAGRYGLRQVPVDNSSVAAESKSLDATTVFMSGLPGLDEAKQYRDDYGVRVAMLDDMAARTDQARRGGANYGSLMALNLDALREALDCKKVRLGDE